MCFLAIAALTAHAQPDEAGGVRELLEATLLDDCPSSALPASSPGGAEAGPDKRSPQKSTDMLKE